MALILKRAAELQERSPALPTSRSGHSLDEIKQIALEVGIDPELIDEAQLSLEQLHTADRSPIIGYPSSFHLERTVSGEFRRDDFDDVRAAIARVTHNDGTVTESAGSIEWKHEAEEVGTTQVTLTPKDGQTKIRVLGRYQDLVAWTYIGGTITGLASGGLISAFLDPSLGGVLAILAGSLSASLAGFRKLWQRVGKGRERTLRRVLDAATDQVAHSIAESASRER